MKIIVISDTHNLHDKVKVPDGDVLVHCGDFTGLGTVKELISFNSFLGKLPHKKKIIIPGNHDILFEKNQSLARSLLSNASVLIDELIEIEGIKFFGSPWTPAFGNWAFMRNREKLQYTWERIPEEIDVLITHGPPMGILDKIGSYDGSTNVGCQFLANKVKKIKPKAHLFGHIHEGYGRLLSDDVLFINAAVCDGNYRPINKPMVLNLDGIQI